MSASAASAAARPTRRLTQNSLNTQSYLLGRFFCEVRVLCVVRARAFVVFVLFVVFVVPVVFVVGSGPLEAAALTARPAFRFAARSIICASIAPASPPLAGRFDLHTAGV